jgi:hypothetical protein
MASALSIPRSAKRAMRMVWFGMAVIVVMLGVALVFLLRTGKEVPAVEPASNTAIDPAVDSSAEPSAAPWEDVAIDGDALESAAALPSSSASAPVASAVPSASAAVPAPKLTGRLPSPPSPPNGFGALPAPSATSGGQFLPQLQPSASP